MELNSIGGALSSLKMAREIAKTMLAIRDDKLMLEKVLELNAIILSAQESALSAQRAQFALIDRERDLEKEIAAMKDWSSEKRNYQLEEVGFGAFAYVYHSQENSSEPVHKICANCYQQDIKSILQMEIRKPLAEVLVCNACHAEIYQSGHASPDQAAKRR